MSTQEIPDQICTKGNEDLLKYAVELLGYGSAKADREATEFILTWDTLYHWLGELPDDNHVKDQLQRLQDHLGKSIRILETTSPFLQMRFILTQMDVEELVIPDLLEPDTGVDLLERLFEENVLSPLEKLLNECETAAEFIPSRKRNIEKTRKYLLTRSALLYYSQRRPKKAHPYTGLFKFYLRAVYIYITGDKKDQLRNPKTLAFEWMRTKHPELLPEKHRNPTKRKLSRQAKPRSKKS